MTRFLVEYKAVGHRLSVIGYRSSVRFAAARLAARGFER
jgi:hypothetical protein